MAEFPANLEARTVATDIGEVILEPGESASRRRACPEPQRSGTVLYGKEINR
ncbi:MAG: hypothetical protein M3392_00255 [Actinomycetota bacterium]|nr:hypothetical protein [Actinomycetota bacterium]